MPDKASQLGDRKEAALVQQWLADFRTGSHKSAAFVGSHVGVFHAASVDGVPYLVNGNSGKNPAGAPDNGGFTGWTMLGIEPSEGRTSDLFDVPSDDAGMWLRAEVHARTDAVSLSAPERLYVGERSEAAATVTQDGTRTVPVAWPMSADWAGARVDVVGDDHDGRSGAAPVVSFDPASGTLLARRAGTAVLRVTVNGVSAQRQITVRKY